MTTLRRFLNLGLLFFDPLHAIFSIIFIYIKHEYN